MSKRILVIGLTLGLLAGALAMPAEAKKKKKKPAPPTPVATTLYMEGAQPIGEAEQLEYLQLAGEEPSSEKSFQIVNYGGGPNTTCAGNALFPVFLGPLSGTVTGDIKVTFKAASTSGSVDVRVWPDIAAQACNDAYIEPARSAIVALPAGQGTVEAVLSGADFEASGVLMVQITPVLVPPFVGRMFYGTADSKVEFGCLPPSGATTCIP